LKPTERYSRCVSLRPLLLHSSILWHPIEASGVRMLFEMYLQLQGKADKRQIKNPKFGLTHNLGGIPVSNTVSVLIIGL